MDRIKVSSGTKQTLEKVFDNLQDKVQLNLNRRMNRLFSSFGIICDFFTDPHTGDITIAANDTAFKLSIQDGSTIDPKIVIEPGRAISPHTGSHIAIGSAITQSLTGITDATGDATTTINTEFRVFILPNRSL